MKNNLELIINCKNLEQSLLEFTGKLPFDHCVIDNFFHKNIAEKIQSEFMDYDDERWYFYENSLENKKTNNDWGNFPAATYQVFQQLLSTDFLRYLERALGGNFYIDHGLHGGGWHIHGSGGNLNPHLDYSIHPKMKLMRKLNIIIYMSKELNDAHGGHLGLWEHDLTTNGPGKLIKEIQPKFNRAVIFDTTQNSWHGMSRPLVQPVNVFRKSLAVYYLIDPPSNADTRERALFAPREEQKNNSEVLELIKLRADSRNFYKAYRK